MALGILKTNYANFYSCNIPVFETLRNSVRVVLGAWLTQLLYVLIVTLLTVLFVLGCYLIYRLITLKIQSKHRDTQHSIL